MVCSVTGCSLTPPRGGRRYCNTHYQRRRRLGIFGPPGLLTSPSGVGHITPRGYRQFQRARKFIYEHREVWEHHFGPIPSGFHVHHKDGNKLNNKLENLQILSQAAHQRLHLQQRKG